MSGGLDGRAERLAGVFRQRTGRSPAGVWAAPGRVNLIGEHLDYNGGPVLPFAIERVALVAAAPRADGVVRCWSEQFGGPVQTTAGELRHATGWAAYVMGTIWALRQDGGRRQEAAGLRDGAPEEPAARLFGIDLVVDSDVPAGAGLGSSAALECAVAVATDALDGGRADMMRLASAGRRAENEVAGAPVGIMDQIASLAAQAGHAVLLDCATLHTEPVALRPWEAGLELVAVDTRVRHDLAAGEYARRRRECEQAARALGVACLADATHAALEGTSLPPPLDRRTRHVVSEVARVHAAVANLRGGDPGAVGALLTSSHRSLGDDYEVSCRELDAAVEALLEAGALGARMTGGGFGGCVVGLLPADRVGGAERAMSRVFGLRHWRTPSLDVVRPAEGARRLR